MLKLLSTKAINLQFYVKKKKLHNYYCETEKYNFDKSKDY